MVKKIVLVMVFPALALRNTVFGSVSMAWVIVPAAMNLVRSCGSLGVTLNPYPYPAGKKLKGRMLKGVRLKDLN
jgi:hypothetical protein